MKTLLYRPETFLQVFWDKAGHFLSLLDLPERKFVADRKKDSTEMELRP